MYHLHRHDSDVRDRMRNGGEHGLHPVSDSLERVFDPYLCCQHQPGGQTQQQKDQENVREHVRDERKEVGVRAELHHCFVDAAVVYLAHGAHVVVAQGGLNQYRGF